MANPKKAIFNWSGGKDSTLALYNMLQHKEYEVLKLLTSVNSEHERISMHGVRKSLLMKQAEAIGIPLEILEVPGELSMQEYDALMKLKMGRLKETGITCSIFGDIFLEDLRKYREEKLASIGIKTVFPLWKKNTTQIINEFLALGFKTITVCVDAKVLDASFAGRIIDEKFLADLPPGVDPCGENGEFHTFAFDGPLFRQPVSFKKGQIVFKEYKSDENANWNSAFWYCDLLPV